MGGSVKRTYVEELPDDVEAFNRRQGRLQATFFWLLVWIFSAADGWHRVWVFFMGGE